MSELFELTEGSLNGEAQWKRVSVDGKLTARITCPDCRRQAVLGSHDISSDGWVVPPFKCESCSFYDAVSLQGWRG